jgi:hypothetical protein
VWSQRDLQVGKAIGSANGRVTRVTDLFSVNDGVMVKVEGRPWVRIPFANIVAEEYCKWNEMPPPTLSTRKKKRRK